MTSFVGNPPIGGRGTNQLAIAPDTKHDIGSGAQEDFVWTETSTGATKTVVMRRIYIQTTSSYAGTMFVRWGQLEASADMTSSENYDIAIGAGEYWESPSGVNLTQLTIASVGAAANYWDHYVVKGWT